jgi:hypothetical protein
MGRAQTLGLRVAGWAAILARGDAREELGEIADRGEIPSGLRRRMPAFTSDAVRCGLPLIRRAPNSDLVFCSRNGDLTSTLDLLSDLARGELLSPATFSMSVHNAAAGLVGQALGQKVNHTAIAGGAQSLAAGLTDAYARLATHEANSVVLIYADIQLPPIYREFDQAGPQVQLAMLLTEICEPVAGPNVGPYRTGAEAVARAFMAGADTLQFSPSLMIERAA